ncbi:unnamed protein product [Timema podura]|uniref:Uncharacterized protein n=1 Tax=Timema podura TaxID=61482 RepID=A0ABN7PHJ0_TIMPD|nr:unnamed protein product [Timema podura]
MQTVGMTLVIREETVKRARWLRTQTSRHLSLRSFKTLKPSIPLSSICCNSGTTRN